MDIFSTAFLPDINYLHHLYAATEPVIDLGEHYVKQTSRNRTSILTSNGALVLSIPLRKKDSKKIGDIEISYAEDWQIKFLRAIRSAYTNSPYYEHYQPGFEEMLMKKEPCLHLYNRQLLEWMQRELSIEKQVGYSSTYVEQGEQVEHDYRAGIFGSNRTPQSYKQVFSYKMDFVPGLSAIDLLFNKGPESLMYIQ
jgi:hypothetical protein